MIQVAVIGAGHWGPNLIRNFHNKQLSQVAVVADADPARLARVRLAFPEVRVTEDALEAVRDKAVDAVVIATPTSTHYPLAKAALEARKHTLVEKPITTEARQGEELCQLAARAERVLMVGHVFLYNAAVQRAKTHIDSGELGSIYYISMVRTNLGPIRMDVNAAWDLAAHDISIVNYWLGRTPLRASATGGTWINRGIEDAVFGTLTFPGNVLVHLHTSWLSPRKARDITVVGERRMLTFDDMNLSEPLRLYDKQVTEARVNPTYIDSFASFRASVREGDILIPKVSAGEPLKSECDHFLECIAKGTEPLSGGASGVAVVRALEAIGRSLKNGGREEAVES